MNEQDRFNAQYRRPRLHLADEGAQIRPTVDRRQLLTGTAMLLGMALLLIAALAPKSTVDDALPEALSALPEAVSALPEAAQVRTDAQQTTGVDCQIIQHMAFPPCGHTMTRRQVIPAELAGQNRETVSAAYDGWQITSFASAEVVMEKSLPLYCPEHLVLMPDEGGMLCIFQNKYGDAMALVKELDLLVSELSGETQAQVRSGKAFDTIEAAEKWLEGADS